MTCSSFSASAFALAAGLPVDARMAIHVQERSGPSDARLIIAVEPMEPTARGRELAALALATIRDEFVAEAGQPPATALLRAFAAANRALLAENRPLSGCRWERRVYVGATAVAVAGRETTIVQAPPTQAIVVQDRQFYAFPDLASWRADYVPDSDEPEPDPLGCCEAFRPSLFRTVAAPGDAIVLCASNVAYAIARNAAAGKLAAKALSIGDPSATLDAYGEIAATHALDDTFVAVVRMDALACRPRSFLSPRPPRAADASVGAGANWPTQDALTERGAPSRTGVARASAPAWQGGSMMQTGAIALTANPFARIGMHATGMLGPGRKTMSPVALPTRRRLVNAPGAMSVHRYRGERSAPAGLTAGLPRGLDGVVRGRIAAVGFAALALAGGFYALDAQNRRGAEARSAIETAESAVGNAVADPATAREAIAEAEVALTAARAAGADPALLRTHEQALDDARDTAWSIGRLGEPHRIGSLPQAMRGHPVRLLALGDAAYLAGDGFYQIDAPSGALVQVLAPEQPIVGGALGPIVDGAADDVSAVLTDGFGAARLNQQGAWEWASLKAADDGSNPAAGPLAAFNGALYALTTDGAIVKYDTDGASMTPREWASPVDFPDLAQARDLVVDGRVNVLLDDGRVLAFYKGTLETAQSAPVTPELSGEAYFASAPDSRALYIVEPGARIGGSAGRIIRFDAGGATQQFLVPRPGSGGLEADLATRALGAAIDVAVLEGSGTIYFLSGVDIWQATLPPIVGA
ncbi:MAG: PQQ-like beta-propeller repeat protein [Thermomicrobiales bacterium]|nr:PQQ-like beta-propeller repeat protein [Thermomicrobiales bacterium]